MTAPLQPTACLAAIDAAYESRSGTVGKELSLGDFEVVDEHALTATTGGGPVSKSSGFGFIAVGKVSRIGEALIALRGTATRYDVVSDLATTISPGANGAGVHSGFQDVYATFKPEMTRRLGKMNPSCIHVVGHSLGGALATLAAHDLKTNANDVKLYTFGSPRVGLANFARSVDARLNPSSIFRCAHVADPVAMLPVLPFWHVSQARGGYLLKWPSEILDADAHARDGYKLSLRNVAWGDLRRVSNPFSSLATAQAWLERAADSGARIVPYSATAMRAVAGAVNLLAQAVAAAPVIAGVVAETGLDWIAKVLADLSRAQIALGRVVRNLMIVCLKLVGASVSLIAREEAIKESMARWVLQTLFQAVGASAARALRSARA